MRDAYQYGEFRLSELPAWSNHRIREDGTPQVLNFRNAEDRTPDVGYREKLDRWAREHRPKIDVDITGCRAGLKQTEIEESEGGVFPNFDPDRPVPLDVAAREFGVEASPNAPETTTLGEVVADELPRARDQRCARFDMTPGCYALNSHSQYCAITRIRDFYRTGRIQTDDLAPWMDPALREDGTPQVHDFREDPKGQLVWHDLKPIFRWARRHDLPMSVKRNTTCTQHTTQTDIERTEGGPRYLPKDMLVPRNLFDLLPQPTDPATDEAPQV